MKIISWNINGYRSVTGQNKRIANMDLPNNLLFEFINNHNPDILSVQETKSEPSQIRPDLLSPYGYLSNYNWSKARKGYSGVATFSKNEPTAVKSEIGIEQFDIEGRIIQTDFENFVLLNIYFPNGTSGKHRVEYKLNFYDAIFNYTDKLRYAGKEIIMCGDYNTAHKEIDLARPKENVKSSGFLPEEREKLHLMEQNGWIDSFRKFNKDGENYTWWDQKSKARDRNIGWRIDYFWYTKGLDESVINAYHLNEEYGSDHCPIVIELA